MDEDQQERKEELRREVGELRRRLDRQEALLAGREEWEGHELYAEVRQLDLRRVEKQCEYQRLMKEHFRFAKGGWVQKAGDDLLQQKLNKGIRSLIRQIENILQSRSSKSSLSNTSLFDRVESMDWMLSDRAEKYIKEQEKVKVEIGQLERILQSIERGRQSQE